MLIPLKTQEAKSNNLRRLLLFVFMGLAVPLWAGVFPADTLIVDGEVIYIEPKSKPVNVDSLKSEGKKDILLPKASIVWSLSFSPLGMDFHRTTWTGAQDSLPYVSSFLGENKYFQLSYTANTQAAVFLNDYLGVYAGLGYSRLTCDAHRLDLQSLAADTSRLRFENRDGSLFEYFKYPVGIGFETDTLQRTVQESAVQLNYLHIPIGMRVFPLGNNRKLAWFADLGGVWRMRMNTVPDVTITKLNEKGTVRNEVVRGSSFKQVIFMAQVRLGLQGQFAKGWYWEAQAAVLQFPESNMNASEILSLRAQSWSFQASMGKYFGR